MAVRAGTAGWGGTRLGRVLGAGAACLGLGAALACLDRPAVGAAAAALSLRLEERLGTQTPAGPARIGLGPHGRDIRLAGELGEGTAERLRAILDANPHAERLHLTSEGGLVAEGQAIGDLVAARNLATYVPDYCVSACTLAFVRGHRRFLVEGGRLGFHAPYEAGLFGQAVQADGVPERTAYLAAGLDPAFVTEALATASADLWVPDTGRLLSARVVTETVDTGRFPDSTLDDDPSPAGARAAILRALPLLGSAPGAVADLAAWYAEAYRTGRPEAESVAGLRRRAAAGIARGLAQADASTVLDAGRLLLRAMLAARDGDREACARIGAGADLVEAGEVLGDGAAVPALVARAGIVAVIAPLPDSGVPARACATEIHAYARALAKAPAEAAPAVRALMQRAGRPVREASALP
ncbi:hypothetical protein [Methylobacterium sp. J-090]|uniref:COG3904 family protein n=1 Tax=Methylobacterium sp. J-090 TaxID=2836666 RepID=UPI001FB86AC9|nr:hypothetical protein [Methylobacterium sp. J-090]MCJ2083381.1 hypothetical protein [Methylobacterium sp. J-090]